MSTLKRQEAVGNGLRRIACQQVESAIRSLTRQPGQGAAALESIRGAQSALALIEPDLPRPAIRTNQALIGRLTDGLAELTGPHRLLELLDARHKKTPTDPQLAKSVKALRKRWSAASSNGSALSTGVGSFDPAIYRLVADMAELRGHIGEWPTQDIPDDAVPRGLRRAYAKARRLATPPINSDELKQLADALGVLDWQMGALSKACPPMLKAQRKLVTKAHAALRQQLADLDLDAALKAEAGEAAAQPVVSIESTADEAVNDLAPALAETPAAFSNRVQVYWQAWRGAS